MIAAEDSLIPFQTSTLSGDKWIIFAPHPDDESIGMAGTIADAIQRGVHVTLIVVTNGAYGYTTKEEEKSIIERRKKETHCAINSLGIQQLFFLDQPDRQLYYSKHTIDVIKGYVDQVCPDVAFIPSALELHPDHRITSEIVWSALFALNYQGQLFSYEISVQSQITQLIDISDVVEKKKKAILCYVSQLDQNNYLDTALALNKARTYTLPKGIQFAEGFMQLDLYQSSSFSAATFRSLEPFWKTEHKISLPLVSVIIRTKDRPTLLQRALNCIIHQDYPNIELVIINDGGIEIDHCLSDIKAKLNHIQSIRLTDNLGRAAAANVGLEKASGEFIQFLDDDDELDFNHISTLIQTILDNKALVAYSGIRSQTELNFNQAYSHALLAVANFIPIHAVVFSRQFIDQGIRMDKTLTVYEDWDFWLQIAQQAPFVHCPKITATYHVQGLSDAGLNANNLVTEHNKLIIYNKWKAIWSAEMLQSIFEALLQRQNELDTEVKKQIDFVKQRNSLINELQNNQFQQSSTIEKFMRENQACIDSQQLCIAEKERVYQECQKMIHENQAMVEERNQKLNDVYHSSSWKITSPLRFIKRLISRK